MSVAWLALAAVVAGGALIVWSAVAGSAAAAGRGAALRLPWLAAGALVACAVLLALAWQAVPGLPGLLGSRVGHLALGQAAILLAAGLAAAWLHSRACC
ncbi:hypothetical protein [Achromobacter sp.]|uniref:hypothetical protein n=1 Tax=Achromobacter sp. TaxID=134375 RepID=UPI0028AA3327|nr:hypothetical protein [Achromobacter sp.]